jgi:hypothetical protein
MEALARKIAIVVEPESFVTEKSLKSLGVFLKRFLSSKELVFYRGKTLYQSANGVICVPIHFIS